MFSLECIWIKKRRRRACGSRLVVHVPQAVRAYGAAQAQGGAAAVRSAGGLKLNIRSSAPGASWVLCGGRCCAAGAVVSATCSTRASVLGDLVPVAARHRAVSLLDAQELRRGEGEGGPAEREQRADLGGVLGRAGVEGHRRDEDRHREADAGGEGDDEQVLESHALGQREAELHPDPAHQHDADRLADEQPGEHQPRRVAHRGQHHAGVAQAEQAEDDLDRVLEPVLEGAERVVLGDLGPVEQAGVDVGVRHHRDDRQQPQRGVQVGPVEADPRHRAADEHVGPEAVDAQPAEDHAEHHRAQR